MRIKLNIPIGPILYSTDIIVRIGDINYGGHLGNDRILSYCHDVRVNFFKSINQSELDFLDLGIIMTDAAVIFKQEAFQGDKLKIDLYIDDITQYGFDLYYRITQDKSNKEVAIAKTGIVFFDYKTRKISKVDKIKLKALF